MLSRRMILVGALGVMLGALPGQRLDAQTSRWSSRPAVEGSYTQLRFAGDGPSLNANGIGAKLTWRSAAAAGATGVGGRTDVGLFATFTPQQRVGQDLRFSTVGAGAVADVRPLASPIAGRVDPFVSVGAGVLRTNVARGLASSPLLDRSHTTFTLAPGAGARVLLTRNVALQGDVRSVLTFRDEVRNNVMLGAGLRLAF